MLVTLSQILQKAYAGHYAVGAFNTSNLEMTQAILNAAERMRSPVIVSTSESAIEYAGMDVLTGMIRSLAQKKKIPVCVHVDHGRNLGTMKMAIMSGGYTSVMIDASHMEYKDNVKTTKKVVRWAKKHGISVEAELGAIAGVEDYIKSRESYFTDPQQAKKFVDATGIDALAVSIGTAHGPAKSLDDQKLDLVRLKKISGLVNMPIVLHGASQGVPVRDIKKAISLGVSKINIDTDLRYAFSGALRSLLEHDKIIYDPRKMLGISRVAVEKKVIEKIKMFGSANCAS